MPEIHKRGRLGLCAPKTPFQYLKETYRKDESKLFRKASRDRMRGDCFEVKDGRFRRDIKNNFLKN